MKQSQFILTIVLLTLAYSITAFGQKDKKEEPQNPNFNAELAKKLGADDYGMKSYVMVILKTGPNDAKITDKVERAKLFKGHFDNMGRLTKEGKLAVAGPFSDKMPKEKSVGNQKRGLFIFATDSLDEAENFVKTDPTVKAGIFVYELTKLYSSAALMNVNEVHKTIQKKGM